MTESVQMEFIKTVQQRSGQDILSCYHCRKCVVGCPVAVYMDFVPNAVHRMIQLGRKRELLQSSSIWICAGCEVCGTRCPNGIETSKVMDTLKQMSEEENSRSEANKIRAMHRAFLSGIKQRGRMHELSLIRDLRLKTGGLFKDMKLGIDMFRLGKLSLFPKKIKDRKGLKKLFHNARRRP